MKFVSIYIIIILAFLGISLTLFATIIYPEIEDQNKSVVYDNPNTKEGFSKIKTTLSFTINESDLEELVIKLEKAYGGEFQVTQVEGELNKYIYTLDSPLETIEIEIYLIPNTFDEEKLKAGIEDILGWNSYNYGVYILDLKSGQQIGINENKILAPGSVSKVPIGLLTLRDVDSGKLTMETTSELLDTDIVEGNVLGPWEVGLEFSIEEYMKFLIIDSDNTAIVHLENLLGGTVIGNQRTIDELGVTHLFRDPHDVTTKDAARIFAGIYYEEYLSKESNDFFLYLLKNTDWRLQTGIPVGIPEPYYYEIAHKTGIVSTYPGYAWADIGIIYGPKTDYVIAVFNEKVSKEDARYKIQLISSLVWETLQA
ncbi:MAG: serine hydrolase [Candidatus Dojkabacteria bacterium]|nr:serine hydrolase [Candidatus Dojkabacteria bacterium]MDQ7020646.1 serine hydrolase [Candidatus Dojkabacteria bacterium]